ncbi:MAG: thioredoxin domain-containing protein [Desulfobacteraceae bacterium]
MSNRLAGQKSPYLLQHAENPVDWYPWGEEAFEKARKEDKPVFLSVGYSTCHWCHVMAHESFEDEGVARVLNQHYVPVKVDREERPDVDQVYMAACIALTGQGGWPLSVFLTPEGKPFYAGTYFPKTGRLGRPGFADLLEQMADKWNTERETVLKAADQLTVAMEEPETEEGGGSVPGLEVLEAGYREHAKSFDRYWGGFGRSPKFPTPHRLSFLMRWHCRDPQSKAMDMVEKTLQVMRRGGIFDHLGLGFHRYSVDQKWTIPHFEKMLYDQALLAMAYTEAFQLTQKPAYAEVAKEIFTYVLRDMTSPEGAFYAAEDADSEGGEGLFYLWKPEQVTAELGEELGGLFCEYYNISHTGNLEDGSSVPHITTSLEDLAAQKGLRPKELFERMKEAADRLYRARSRRANPFKDDKVLTAWNGLMIAALAKGAQVLGESGYREAAAGAYDFIEKNLREGDRLYRRYRDGEAAQPGYLDDYAYLVWGLIELYEAAFDLRYLEEALALNKAMLDLFWDEGGGGLYYAGEDNPPLITRQKAVQDGAMPSGNSVAALNLLRLGRMTGRVELEEYADKMLKAFSGRLRKSPMAYAHFLGAVDFALGPSLEMVIAEDRPGGGKGMLEAVQRRFLPNSVLMMKPPGEDGAKLMDLAPFTASMTPRGGRSAFYLCQGYACRSAVTDLESLEEALMETASYSQKP